MSDECIRSEKALDYLNIQRKLSDKMIEEIKESFDNYGIYRLQEITDIHFKVAGNAAKIAEQDARERAIRAFRETTSVMDDSVLNVFLEHYDND